VENIDDLRRVRVLLQQIVLLESATVSMQQEIQGLLTRALQEGASADDLGGRLRLAPSLIQRLAVVPIMATTDRIGIPEPALSRIAAQGTIEAGLDDNPHLLGADDDSEDPFQAWEEELEDS
jgi:hypothetical protein